MPKEKTKPVNLLTAPCFFPSRKSEVRKSTPLPWFFAVYPRTGQLQEAGVKGGAKGEKGNVSVKQRGGYTTGGNNSQPEVVPSYLCSVGGVFACVCVCKGTEGEKSTRCQPYQNKKNLTETRNLIAKYPLPTYSVYSLSTQHLDTTWTRRRSNTALKPPVPGILSPWVWHSTRRPVDPSTLMPS